VCNYKLEAILQFFAAKLRAKQFPTHTLNTFRTCLGQKKARRGAIDRRRNPIPRCLIGQHLVLIIEMMRTRSAHRIDYRPLTMAHARTHLGCSASIFILIAAAAAHSPHLSNAMINKYLIKFGVSNGEFTKHTRPPLFLLSPALSACMTPSLLILRAIHPRDLVFFMYLAQVRPVLQHLKIHTLARFSIPEEQS
jgi:hypothetical protein